MSKTRKWAARAVLGVLLAWLAACLPFKQPVSLLPGEVGTARFSTLIIISATLPNSETPLPVTETRPPTVTPTATPTLTPSLTPQPSLTLTSTPVPPLQAHEWLPEVVLIQVDQRGGTRSNSHFAIPPEFILYADGRLFLTDSLGEANSGYTQLLTKKLERQEVCSLLNTIDQNGFFDYEPDGYNEKAVGHLVQDATSNLIQVNAWRSNQVNLLGLSSFLSNEQSFWNAWIAGQCPDCTNYPEVSPALRKTYQLLDSYRPLDLKVYQPQRLAIWVYNRLARAGAPTAPNWPLRSPTLAKLYERTSTCPGNPYGKSEILREEAAQDVYRLFSQPAQDGLTFIEGEFTYKVYTRPLLPMEGAPGCNALYSKIPDPGLTVEPETLHCRPSDGVIR